MGGEQLEVCAHNKWTWSRSQDGCLLGCLPGCLAACCMAAWLPDCLARMLLVNGNGSRGWSITGHVDGLIMTFSACTIIT